MGPVFGLLFMGFIALVSLGVFIFWIWMLVDCATNEPSEGNEKIIWILIIIFTGIGALIYLLVRRPQRISQFGR